MGEDTVAAEVVDENGNPINTTEDFNVNLKIPKEHIEEFTICCGKTAEMITQHYLDLMKEPMMAEVQKIIDAMTPERKEEIRQWKIQKAQEEEAKRIAESNSIASGTSST